jgi:hypothetical protein
MTFGTEWPEACVSHFSKGLSAYAPVSFDSMTFSAYDLTTRVLVDGVSSTTTIFNIKSVANGIAIADPVIVGWGEHDLSTFPTEYANSLARRIGVTQPSITQRTGITQPPMTVPTAKVSDPTGSIHSSLSTGAKAGIGVGVILGVFLVALVLFLICLQRTKKKSPAAPSENTAEMEDQYHASQGWFMQSRWRNEVDGSETQKELDSKTVHVVPGPPVELDS